MATTLTELKGERRSSVNSRRERTYTRKFVVETDSADVGPKAVRTTTGIPNVGSTYGINIGVTGLEETDPGAFVQSIDADEIGGDDSDGTAWVVTVQYGPYDTASFGSDPLSWKPVVSFGGRELEKVVAFDKDGNAILNSAGDQFGDPVLIDDSRSTFNIVRNELVSSFSPSFAATYCNRCNADVWNGFAIGTVKLGIISTGDPTLDTNSGLYYYAVNYPVEVNSDGWKASVLDQGFAEKKTVSGVVKSVPITTAGQPISEAVPLDGSGHRLAPGGTPVKLDFDVYPRINFSGLSINLSNRLGA
jgi:hypothetical protein